jgi:hypothetical protein
LFIFNFSLLKTKWKFKRVHDFNFSSLHMIVWGHIDFVGLLKCSSVLFHFVNAIPEVVCLKAFIFGRMIGHDV